MLRERLMWVAWPAFLVAAVLEMLVFAVLDPESLSLFGERLAWSRYSVYTITFFIFWGMTMLSIEFDNRAPTTLSTPLWIPQISMPIGLAILCLQRAGTVFHDMRKIASGVYEEEEGK